MPKETTSGLDWAEEIPHITLDAYLDTFYTLI